MTVSSILQRIQKRAKIAPAPGGPAKPPSPDSASRSLSSANRPNDRVVDPVVARLKAARKAEMEQKQQQLREKKGAVKITSAQKKTPSSKAPPSRNAVKPQGQARRNGAKPGPAQAAPPKPVEKKPKMSFSDLMNKASAIDQSKLSITIKSKSKSPDALRQQARREPTRGAPAHPKNGPPRASGPVQRPKGHTARTPEMGKPKGGVAPVRAPLPIRKPSSHLEQKLSKFSQKHSAQREQEESESDLDSFIASDEETPQVDYDRDEIWSIFNRGKKRVQDFDDYDSDDMEATGAEILEEENRSKRSALDEDRREMEEEARLAALKRARRQK